MLLERRDRKDPRTLLKVKQPASRVSCMKSDVRSIRRRSQGIEGAVAVFDGKLPEPVGRVPAIQDPPPVRQQTRVAAIAARLRPDRGRRWDFMARLVRRNDGWGDARGA
jgi:hypothetical protein